MTITFEFLQMKHLGVITEWHNEIETHKRLSIEDINDWFKTTSSRLDYFVWVIYEDNDLIGEVMVELLVHKKAAIAFIIDPARRLKGYGKKVIKELIDYRFLDEIKEFEAWVDEDNIGSIKCLEAVGFTKVIKQIDDSLIKYVYERN
ncbi:putative N-acetyltransferase YfmK [Paenibacillus sp. CCS19]|uniref:GNAT family N-acetyltransferase n=1 Tax=Paenibacillus sp. CCS19 TaxID=3158387 RepID=UPI0025679969|nr:GNAT family N-acetyltransferase [Paenibacillus cellulosilyticus]GMK37178.1 putative N-acetyltransferase YfmK [Paenibacillus cellulosilyticus]